jgi:hypothetical protein
MPGEGWVGSGEVRIRMVSLGQARSAGAKLG